MASVQTGVGYLPPGPRDSGATEGLLLLLMMDTLCLRHLLRRASVQQSTRQVKANGARGPVGARPLSEGGAEGTGRCAQRNEHPPKVDPGDLGGGRREDLIWKNCLLVGQGLDKEVKSHRARSVLTVKDSIY